MLGALWLSAFMIAGERVQFAADLTPRFTPNQIRNSADATRQGLAKWAKTDEGRKLIAFFAAPEYEIDVIEDPDERAAGRAPQPGIATLTAAHDHKTPKAYTLILNPTFFALPKDMKPIPNEPATPGDMMAVAWAGEALHIYFYAQGISLPHHPRLDFQQEWRAVASELGMGLVTHDDDETSDASRRRALLIVE